MADSAELNELLEERAILRTLYRYCHAVDYGDVAEYVSVFSDDAVFDVCKPTGESLHKENGRDDLERYITKYPGPPEVYNKHIMVDPLIRIDGDEAIVESYFLALRGGADGKPVIGSFGHYDDRLKKIDGAWRIVERIAKVESS